MFKENKSKIAILLFVLVTFSISLYLGYQTIMPKNLPKDFQEKIITLDDITKGEPSFNMTLSHVYNMSKEIHTSGSKEIQEVRTYLTDQITKMGLTYKEDKFDTLIESKGKTELKNYLVKVDAPNTDNGILFVSHYDSTTGGPGVADDMIAVGSILESMRSVEENGSLTNDMYFLFTDGEEDGLLGADNFVKNHTEMKDIIKLVVNVEARGNDGSVIMFETSDNNKEIIKLLNKSVGQMAGFSFTKALYKTMDNDTDLSLFLDNGYSGINFAAIDGGENYHRLSDNYDNLNRDTAYMYYKTTVDLARNLSNANLNNIDSTEDATYFPFFKGITIVVSSSLLIALEIIVCIAAIAWVSSMIIKKKCKLKDIGKMSLISILAILGSVAFSFIEKKVAGLFLEGGTLLELADKLDILVIILALVVILGVTIVMIIGSKKVMNSNGIILGVMPLFIVFTIITLIIFKNAAYLTAIPLFILLICSIASCIAEKLNKSKNTIYIIGTVVISITVAGLFIPVIVCIYNALFIQLFLGYAALIALSVVGCGALVSSLIAPKVVTCPMNKVDIRTADITDLDKIVFVESNCFPKDVMATKETFQKRLDAYPENFFVAQINGEIVGIINGAVTNQKTITDDLYEDVTTNNKDGNHQVVFGLAVIPKYQGKGIATLLLNHYENYAKRNNKNGIILTCKQEHISFYEKRGYMNLGVSESIHGKVVWYDMIKKIGVFQQDDYKLLKNQSIKIDLN